VSTSVCPADLATLREDYLARVFCTSYISYTAPAAFSTTITNSIIYETCRTPTTTVSNAPTTNSEAAILLGFPLVTITTITAATITTPARVGKRDIAADEVFEALVAVYPDKVADPTIAGSTPAEVTLSAKDLSVAAAYSSATSDAILQLSVSEICSSPDETAWTYLAMTPQATSTVAVNKRQGALTPTFFSGRDHRDISSACSRIVNTSTQTTTYFAPDVTASALIDCLNFTTCGDGSPPTLLSGSFYNSTYRVDDLYYTVNLPFEVCIYDTCGNTTHPSSNGIITLGDFTTPQYNNDVSGIPALEFPTETALFVYWDDLYVFPGQAQYMDYSICGPDGNRTATFSWRVGRYLPAGPVFDGQVWSFSATFYENQRSNITLTYHGIPDNGTNDLSVDGGSATFCNSYTSYTTPVRVTQTVTSGTTTVCAPTTSGIMVDRRDETTVRVLDAVVGVYPSKIDSPTITGDTPALATIDSEHLSDSEAYASAISEALDKLTGSQGGSDVTISVASSSLTSLVAQISMISTLNKRAEPAPGFFDGRGRRDVSSVCSGIINSTTQTVTSTVPSATQISVGDCCFPRQLLAGDFTFYTGFTYEAAFRVQLPFEVCIYNACSSFVYPPTNGIVSINESRIVSWDNEGWGQLPATFFTSSGILYAFFDDLTFRYGEPHYMSVQLCGNPGNRNATFIWNVSRTPSESDTERGLEDEEYNFSVTFFEAQPKRIYLKYNNISDQGRNATVGMQSPLQNSSKSISSCCT
jgi:hypothetical protein